MPVQGKFSTIGIFDSGVGGLSVYKSIGLLRPDINTIFIADQAHVPYGSRSLEEVSKFAIGITKYLLKKEAELIVVACNAASAAALRDLRRAFPDVPFVGMEPAVKPAALSSTSGTVGVLATPATFLGKLYASVVERFASNVNVMTSTCPGLVEQIEAGNLNSPITTYILEEALIPMVEAGADSIVLGCTHYPFVMPIVRSIVGPQVNIIDPSPAIARQVDRLLGDATWSARKSGFAQFFTTGDPVVLEKLFPILLNESHPVHHLNWDFNSCIPLVEMA
ncbi:MAG: glutamate racemase [Holophagaceae bacterium]|nr:glutamate racemase [Holophagaceae bacterium]